MPVTELGPRREGLLEAWGEYAATTPESEYHKFNSENRHDRVRKRLNSFIADPSQDNFEALWTEDVLRDAVIGGPSMVLNNWPGTIGELAALFEEMQDAEQYDLEWEADFVSTGALWELYGHMDPMTRPILNGVVLSGLDSFGFETPGSYRDRPGYERFAKIYESLVGHATAGTSHEVPWHFEIEQFLALIGTETRHEVYKLLPTENEYPKLIGWEAEGDAGRIVFKHLEPLLDKYITSRTGGGFQDEATDLWGGNYWEAWKWAHAEHIETTVRSEFTLTELVAEEVLAFLERFKKAPNVELSSAVPTYLLGGRSGGILWSNFVQRTEEEPGEAARVLSLLFDEDQPLSERLTQFDDFYGELASGGPRLSLASMLLMFAYPQQYVMYKYGKFSSFFDEYSDYDVSTGFGPEQYWVLNEACRRILRRLADAFESHPQINEDPSMLDVHTLIWIAVGVEGLDE